VAKDGTVYIESSLLGRLYALRPNGKVRWSFPPEEHGSGIYGMVSGSPPSVGRDGRIYWATSFADPGAGIQFVGRLFALDSSGKELWHVDTGAEGAPSSAPLIAPDGTIYVGASTSADFVPVLYSISPSGNTKWKHALPGRELGGIALGSGNTVIASSSRVPKYNPKDEAAYVSAFRPNGSRVWSRALPPGILTSPVVGPDGTIYVGTRFVKRQEQQPSLTGGSIAAISARGQLKWSLRLGAVVVPPAIGPDGTLYIAAMERVDLSRQTGTLSAVSREGSKRWSRRLPGPISTPAVDGDGMVYARVRGRLVALHPDGSTRWSIDVPASAAPNGPVIASDGRLYCIGRKNVLYVVGER